MNKAEKLKDIVIVGAGGMGGDTQWLIERINEISPTYRILGYIDDGKSQGEIINDFPVLGGMEYLIQYPKSLAVAFAIGNAKTRKKLIQKAMANEKLYYPNLIDPSVIMSPRVQLGKGNIICASAILTMNIDVCDFNLICNRCIVGHDNKMDSYNTLYPGVILSGNVQLGQIVEIGTGSQVIQGINICDNVIIGAGGAVVKNLEKEGTYVGVPLRHVEKD